MAEGADTLAAGTPTLVDAVGRAQDGSARLAGGADRLAAGARRLDAGTGRLGQGAGRLGDGAVRLAAGAASASEGASRLADGSTRLADGSARLGSGSHEPPTGWRRAPTGSVVRPEQRRQIADVVAQPVASEADRLNETPSGASSLAPGVLALALWLGAFVTYLVRQALPGRALAAARPAHRVALAGWLPAVAIGAAQSALLFAVLGAFDVVMDSPVGVAVFLLLPAAVFAAVNQAFVAVLGPRRGGWSRSSSRCSRRCPSAGWCRSTPHRRSCRR